jgi:hypothetical protein
MVNALKAPDTNPKRKRGSDTAQPSLALRVSDQFFSVVKKSFRPFSQLVLSRRLAKIGLPTFSPPPPSVWWSQRNRLPVLIVHLALLIQKP